MRRELTEHLSRRRFLAAGAAVAAGSLCGVAGAYEPPAWVDQRAVGPFLCRSEFPLQGVAAALDDLAGLEKELRRVFALRPCKGPIEVLLFRNAAQHRGYLERRYPTAPYRRGLYVNQGGRSVVFVYRQPEFEIDLRHECTHALLHADLPMVPLWLDEGIAEYFEAPPEERAFHHPHLVPVRWGVRLRRFKTVSELESKHSVAELSSSDYRYAWAWTHFMLHGPEPASRVLWDYLSAVRKMASPGKISERLAEAMPDVERQFIDHFKGWNARVASAG
ncbi:hypothetical protein [Pseudobythopirellula maris]|uniref:hypothetical protein n=1 Tax=Pseudobythopirellula maris TaxID=2527991 RepID=UPI0011B5E597|nr:hypothetical protein [Pseudobythopirellula maris]